MKSQAYMAMMALNTWLEFWKRLKARTTCNSQFSLKQGWKMALKKPRFLGF